MVAVALAVAFDSVVAVAVEDFSLLRFGFVFLLLLLLGAASNSRDQGHPEGGAHGRAPGATLGRMPNVGPACAGIALVALDSKQPKPFLWLLLTEGNPVGLCGFGQRK
jgi:hypothetical protein